MQHHRTRRLPPARGVPALAGILLATLLLATLLAACSQSQAPTPSFRLDATGTALTVAPGSSSSLALQVTPEGGFSGTVNLSLHDTQGQAAAGLSVSPASLKVGASGPTLAGVTLTADPTLASGVETLSLRVEGGGASASVPVLATIEPAPAPDFAIAASPTDVHADLGGSAATTVVVAPQGGFSGTVALQLLTASGAAASGFAASPGTVAVTAGQSTTQAVTINVDSSVAAGSYDLTLRATSGGLTHDVALIVDVGGGAYATHTDDAVAAVPAQVAAADVNGDGNLDLVTANYSQSSISVLIGNGDGTFQPHVDDASGTWPRALVVADLNGDGSLDVVTLNENTTTNGTVSVFLNAGDGTYPTHTNVAVPAHPWDIAAGDLNNDGCPDIVITAGGGATAGTAAVLLNNGAGTFGAAQTVALAGPYTTTSPDAVATADLNGDGNLDVVVTDPVADEVYVLLGKGDGTFQAPVSYRAGYDETSALAIADVNGDGNPDVAALNSGLSSPHTNLVVLLGHGDGSLAAPLATPTADYPSFLAHALALADVNGDGRLDAVVANDSSNTFSVLPGNGDGTFSPHIEYAAPGSPIELTVADLNHDGHPDVVTADSQAATVSVYLWR